MTITEIPEKHHQIFFITKKILSLVLKSFLISFAMLPVFLAFKLNPYLSNELYAKRPHETMDNLLVTSIPICLVLHFLSMIFQEATYLEGLQDLRGTVISASKAMIMLLTQYWLYVILLLEIILFRVLIAILSLFLSLQELQSKRLYLLGLFVALSFEMFTVTYNLCNLKSTHVKRNASKPLPRENTIGNRFGIIRKKAKQAKGTYARRLKMSFFSIGPLVLCELLVYLISFTISAIKSPSKMVVGFYCVSLVALKVLIQTLIRSFLSNANPAGSHYASVMILGCTVSTDTVIRIICSQLSSPMELAIVFTSLGVGEIVVRCYCIFRAISKSRYIHEKKSSLHVTGRELRLLKKSESNIILFLVEVDADIVSEYVAINTSFLLKYSFYNFQGFVVVGSNTSFDLISQLKYVALQYSVEILVDIISCSFESFHPKIRELVRRQPKLSILGDITANCRIGILCSSALIVLLIY